MTDGTESVRRALESMGLKPIDSVVYAKIPVWKSWYTGLWRDFHFYKVYNGKKVLTRKRKTMGMAQRICEDWANLLLNERLEIAAETDEQNRLIAKVLEDNRFSVYANQLAEMTFALGTGAFAENVENGRVRIDYIRGDCIFPLSTRGSEITECAFCSARYRDGKPALYVQAHTLTESGGYRIQNALFDDGGSRIPLPDGVLPEIYAETRLFQIITPNVVNKTEIGSPFGSSVFAGSIDYLEGCDLIYDSFCNDFQLGLKRIMIPVTMARMITDESGDTRPVFDENDVAFYAVPEDQKLTEIDLHLRADEHIAALREQIDLLSDHCGLGTHRFCVDSGANVKTATEVISENSVLYQNLEKHRKTLKSALSELARAILYLCRVSGAKNIPIRVDFDDSIMQDKTAAKADDRLDVSLGVMPKWEYRVKWYGETERQARRVLAEQEADGTDEE